MTVTPALILDIILLAVIVFTVVYYARKGFVAGLIALVGNLASLALAWIVSGKLSPSVFENFFRSGILAKTTQTLQQQGTLNIGALFEGLQGIVPQTLLSDLQQKAEALLASGAPDIALQVVDNIIAPLVIPLIGVVVFFGTFVLCRVLIALLVAVLTNLNRIPVLGEVNRTLGIVVGLIAGLLNVLLLLLLVWAIVVLTNGSLPLLRDDVLSGSYFYTFFSAYNPFIAG